MQNLYVQEKLFLQYLSSNKSGLVKLLLLFTAFASVYIYFFGLQAKLELVAEFNTNQVTPLKVYWAHSDKGYRESNSNSILVDSSRYRYSMRIGNLSSITRLRIDPMESDGSLIIHEVKISQLGYKPIKFTGSELLRLLQPLQQIDHIESYKQAAKIQLSGRDGQLELKLGSVSNPVFPLIHVFNVLLIALITFCLRKYINERKLELNYVPWMLFIGFSLSLIMSSITTFNVHPDEKVHLEAVNYYSNHVLPPAIDDPEIEDTFSLFGRTRLSSYEIFYPVAGYASRLLEPLKTDDLTEARILMLLMFFGILLISIRFTDFRYMALPMLITPQVWYLFSYVNSDGFALFLLTVLAFQIAVRNSQLNQFLDTQLAARFWPKAMCFGTFLGCIFLLKQNYYFFLVFATLYLAWKFAYGEFSNKQRVLKRFGLLIVIGLMLPGLRFALDIKANGFDATEKQLLKIEQTADRIYRPSTPLAEKHMHLYLNQRDISLDHMIHYMEWPKKVLNSSFGSYGYLQYLPNDTYYELIKLCGFLLFMTLLLSILINAPGKLHWLFLMTTFSAMALIGTSLWLSWSVNFQPQGRYLAPILPMLGVLIYHSRAYLFKNAFNTLIILMFALSAYSFIFIGLTPIAKTSFAYG